MKTLLAGIFCFIGYGWALFGLSNIIYFLLYHRDQSAGWAMACLFFNMLVCIWPGLTMGSKGTDWLSQLKKDKIITDNP